MATISRADFLSAVKRQQEFFSDFLNSFAKTPVGDQLGRTINEQSVSQSLKNLILTNLGERLFQPMIGSNITSTLFDPFQSSVTPTSALEFFISNTIKNNEPRVYLIEVDINESDIDKNSLVATIVYTLINSSDPITLNFVLKRVR